MNPDPRKPTSVYRAFDAAGALLYVGMTFRPKTRFQQHARWSRWWADVADVRVEHHENRWAAEAVEAAAILAENPRHNKWQTVYLSRLWIGSWQEFPVAFPVAAVPAPPHVAIALGTPAGVLAVRHMSRSEQDGAEGVLSTAWAIPEAWGRRGVRESRRDAVRSPTEDEVSALSMMQGARVAVRERLSASPGRPWFVEEVSALRGQDAWEFDELWTSARPA